MLASAAYLDVRYTTFGWIEEKIQMKILCACEESQAVTKEFRAQPPPEKTLLERMREVDRIINVEKDKDGFRRVWRVRDQKESLGATIWLDDCDFIRICGDRYDNVEILLDSGEWKNLKEVVG